MVEILLVSSSVINALAAGVVRCGAGIVDWIVEEVVSMDRKTRKILATKLAVNTPGIRGVLRGEQILAWLPQR